VIAPATVGTLEDGAYSTICGRFLGAMFTSTGPSDSFYSKELRFACRNPIEAGTRYATYRLGDSSLTTGAFLRTEQDRGLDRALVMRGSEDWVISSSLLTTLWKWVVVDSGGFGRALVMRDSKELGVFSLFTDAFVGIG
jgi:hypothetical protein